jgi:hypothetical protein
MRLVISLVVAAFCLAPVSALAAAEAEELRSAKSLYFDRRYAESRSAWQAVLETSRGGDADTAAYWIARCSEQLGEPDRALSEYTSFLARRPGDTTLAEEARIARIGIAARLYREGRHQHLSLVQQGLADRGRAVRYFAAFQLANLGPDLGRPALPVLRRILTEEKDPDLVDRAKLALLKVDPSSLDTAPRPTLPAERRQVGWIKVRIQDKGARAPKVTVNVPIGLAELAYKSLPEEARRELARKGYAPENFWQRLKGMGPAEILSIEGPEGETIRVYTE